MVTLPYIKGVAGKNTNFVDCTFNRLQKQTPIYAANSQIIMRKTNMTKNYVYEIPRSHGKHKVEI